MDKIIQITGVGNRLVALDENGKLWESILDEDVGFLSFDEIKQEVWRLGQQEQQKP